MSNISNFINSFAKTDLARPSKFDVEITLPNKLTEVFSWPKRNNMERVLTFRCETTQLPGKTFSTVEQKFGTNPIEKHAAMPVFNDIDMTFIVSDTMNEKYFFDAWFDWIYGASQGPDFKYKSFYVAPSIKINQYDLYNQKSYIVELGDAFPVSMNQMDLKWNTDDFHKLTVTFSYTRWKTIEVPPVQKPVPISLTGSLVSLDDRTYNPANDPNNFNYTPEQARALTQQILLNSSQGRGIGGTAAQ